LLSTNSKFIEIILDMLIESYTITLQLIISLLNTILDLHLMKLMEDISSNPSY